MFSRDEAVECGFTESAIWRRRRAREWIELLPGVYCVADVVARVDQKAHALLLWAGPGSALSHETAAERLLLPIKRAKRPLIVTVPRGRNALAVEGYEVRTSRDLGKADVRTLVNGLRVTAPARTIVDLAPSLQPRMIELFCEEAFRRHRLRPEELSAAVSRLGNGRRGLDALRAHLATRLAEPTDSSLEDLMFSVMRGADIERPWRQVRLHSDEFEFSLTADFAYPARRIVIETHGHRTHGTRPQWVKDQRTCAGLTAAGWAFLPITRDDLTLHTAMTIKRVQATLARRPPRPLKEIVELVGGEPEPPLFPPEIAAIALRPPPA